MNSSIIMMLLIIVAVVTVYMISKYMTITQPQPQPENTQNTEEIEEIEEIEVNINCEGTHAEPPICPTNCGYQGETFTLPFNMTVPKSGNGAECPGSLEYKCPSQPACSQEITIPNVNCKGTHTAPPQCPTHCGYKGETFTRIFNITVPKSGNGVECPGPLTYKCPAQGACQKVPDVPTTTQPEVENTVPTTTQPEVENTVPDVNCKGHHDPVPVCPTHCGYQGETFTRDFNITVSTSGNGASCPGPLLYTCPSQPACDYFALKNCVWGSTTDNDQGCPAPNEYPGGPSPLGTCYKKPIDTSMFKRISPSNADRSDAQIGTRCYNPNTNTGKSVPGTLGTTSYAQAKRTCEAQGAGWRLPRTIDEVGKACGTGHGLDASYVWMDKTFKVTG